jgi:hypothetical protein
MLNITLEWAGSNIYFKPDEPDGSVGSLTPVEGHGAVAARLTIGT